jgi:hypothetical protein
VRSLSTGWVAGVVGTAALTCFEQIERALLAGTPPYAAVAVARGLLRRARDEPAAAAGAHIVGLALRWLYGPALGAVYGAWRGNRASRSVVRSGLFLGGAVYSFELLAMPASGATKPIRRWKPEELLLLLAHTSVFGLVTAKIYQIAERANATKARSARH